MSTILESPTLEADRSPQGVAAADREFITYEQRLNQNSRWALSEGSVFFEDKGAVQQAMQRIAQRLDKTIATWRPDAAVCVILASGGYPGSYAGGKIITGLEKCDATIFHAGTKREGGEFLTAGGRVLGVTVLAPTLAEAKARAYAAAGGIHFEGMQFRSDIAAKDCEATVGAHEEVRPPRHCARARVRAGAGTIAGAVAAEGRSPGVPSRTGAGLGVETGCACRAARVASAG